MWRLDSLRSQALGHCLCSRFAASWLHALDMASCGLILDRVHCVWMVSDLAVAPVSLSLPSMTLLARCQLGILLGSSIGPLRFMVAFSHSLLSTACMISDDLDGGSWFLGQLPHLHPQSTCHNQQGTTLV